MFFGSAPSRFSIYVLHPSPPTPQSLDKQRGLAGPKYSDAYLLRLFREADKGYTHGVQYEDLLTGEPGTSTNWGVE